MNTLSKLIFCKKNPTSLLGHNTRPTSVSLIKSLNRLVYYCHPCKDRNEILSTAIFQTQCSRWSLIILQWIDIKISSAMSLCLSNGFVVFTFLVNKCPLCIFSATTEYTMLCAQGNVNNHSRYLTKNTFNKFSSPCTRIMLQRQLFSLFTNNFITNYGGGDIFYFFICKQLGKYYITAASLYHSLQKYTSACLLRIPYTCAYQRHDVSLERY